MKFACIEEIALVKGFIDAAQFKKLLAICEGTAYGAYLRRVLREHQESTT